MKKETLQDLEKWSLIEENSMKQKSRDRWIKLGDSNTKYCSDVFKERGPQKKQIVELTSLGSWLLSNQEDIKEQILSFYKGLVKIRAYRVPTVSKEIMKSGPKLCKV